MELLNLPVIPSLPRNLMHHLSQEILRQAQDDRGLRIFER